jgi:FkbM family methyltransferase
MFVKVGANDGVTGDPCSDLLLSNSKWKGLLIEPVPYCFDKLRRHFQDPERFCFERVAIGAPTGATTFYYVDENATDSIPNLPLWFNQLGSFDRNHIIKHLDGQLEPFIIQSTVNVCSLNDVLLRHHIHEVHLLHIDTEGHDYEVLKTLDLTKHRPLLLFIEHKHLHSSEKTEMLDLLHNSDYCVSDCGVDYFALSKKAQGQLRLTTLMDLPEAFELGAS